MKISVFGTGYVGLVSGTCFAEMGFSVCCVDIDKKKIEGLNNGNVPIYEPGLKELIEQNTQAGRLSFTNEIKAAVNNVTACFICVGTPTSNTGEADLRYVESVARDIGRNINNHTVIVVKSTVPVGTCIKVKNWIQEELNQRQSTTTFSIASNPEFLKEGVAVNDFMKPDRVVIGIEDDFAKKVLLDIYATFTNLDVRIYSLDIASAEMTKYASNCFLASKISFINEMANICERVGADIEMIRQAMGADKRIGHQFLFPGVGYGGSCFPKDVKALISSSKKLKYTPRILEAVDAVNDEQKTTLYHKICQWCAREGIKLSNLTCCVWGLSFKPDTDDIRESPALALIKILLNDGVQIQAHDPKAISTSKAELPESALLKYDDDQYEALKGADILCIMTEWRPYRHPDIDKILSLLGKRTIFDGRNILFDLIGNQKDVTLIGVGRSLNT